MAINKKKIKAEYRSFLKQYARKHKNSPDPNDRHYDRKLEEKIKRMKPADLCSLLDDDYI